MNSTLLNDPHSQMHPHEGYQCFASCLGLENLKVEILTGA